LLREAPGHKSAMNTFGNPRASGQASVEKESLKKSVFDKGRSTNISPFGKRGTLDPE